jgi:hypothetical protein
MELNQLEQLIDSTNLELLSGNTTPVHSMKPDEVEAFVKKLEILYKNCIKIRLEKSLKPYKTGLDFSKYAAQEEDRKKKAAEKKQKLENAPKKEKKPKTPSVFGGIDMAEMIKSMSNMATNYCKEHKMMKTDCPCPKEDQNAA